MTVHFLGMQSLNYFTDIGTSRLRLNPFNPTPPRSLQLVLFPFHRGGNFKVEPQPGSGGAGIPAGAKAAAHRRQEFSLLLLPCPSCTPSSCHPPSGRVGSLELPEQSRKRVLPVCSGCFRLTLTKKLAQKSLQWQILGHRGGASPLLSWGP